MGLQLFEPYTSSVTFQYFLCRQMWRWDCIMCGKLCCRCGAGVVCCACFSFFYFLFYFFLGGCYLFWIHCLWGYWQRSQCLHHHTKRARTQEWFQSRCEIFSSKKDLPPQKKKIRKVRKGSIEYTSLSISIQMSPVTVLQFLNFLAKIKVNNQTFTSRKEIMMYCISRGNWLQKWKEEGSSSIFQVGLSWKWKKISGMQKEEDDLVVIILGSAQDAGLPQVRFEHFWKFYFQSFFQLIYMNLSLVLFIHLIAKRERIQN